MDDTYEEVNDPAITVMLDISVNGSEYDNTFALIWTTTPWTIPVNIAAGVHKELEYCKVFCHSRVGENLDSGSSPE